MEVSRRKPELAGQELIDTVVSLVGLPNYPVQDELHTILEQSGQAPEDVSIEDLREALIEYLEALNNELLSEEMELMNKKA